MKKLSDKFIISIGIALFFVFIVVIIFSQMSRITKSQTFESPIVFPEEFDEDGFWIEADIVAIDQLNGTMSIQFDFFPSDEYVDENDRLTHDIDFLADTANGVAEHRYKKGSRINTQTLSFNLLGTINDYPFDSYSSDLIFELISSGSETDPAILEPIPFGFEFYTETSGYLIDILQISQYDGGQESPVSVAEEAGFLALDINVQHSKPVFAFILFLMALQWILAMTAFIVLLVIIVQGRKVTIPNFGWLGALVFAQISLRNAMPDTPPIGTLGDSISFFWVLGIIAISMLALVLTWVIRGE